MSIDKIIHMLHTETGMDVSITGEFTYRSSIRTRMQDLNIESTDAYLKLLEKSAEEMGLLIDEVIVPETWFFREKHAFDAMLKNLRNNNSETSQHKRILCLPSSSGEEAYSIAIKLLESGYKTDEFIIDAHDISQRNILTAKHGIYRKHSFRKAVPSRIVNKYFTKYDNEYQIADEIKHSINFSQANLFDATTLTRKQHYDAVFCRNLLIYFNREEKKIAVEKLDATLKNNGILLLGHSESSIIPTDAYTPCNTAHSFGFIKAKNEKSKRKRSIIKNAFINTMPKADIAKNKNKKQSKIVRTPQVDTRPPIPHAIEVRPTKDSLKHANQLANSGDLDQALDTLLTTPEDLHNCEYFTLAGTIYSALHNPEEAEKYFRKALFLEPDYYDALMQLSLLLQNKGDDKNARLLRKRAERNHNTKINSGLINE